MKNVLIVVDMQKDFIDGSLGSPEAQAIVPNVVEIINEYQSEYEKIFYTLDTHYDNYLNTLEGKLLPVPHCVKGTDGYLLDERLPIIPHSNMINKNTFGFDGWDNYLDENEFDSIEICGLCTDICVISNALVLRMLFPNKTIVCNAAGCAGTTPERHKAALDVMRSCQIDVVNDY